MWPLKIVIDPGHGGRDPGAVARGALEKAIVWDLALRIKQKLSGYKVSVDVYQPSCIMDSTADDELYRPPAHANKVGADFFISLHVNSGKGQGFESYVFSKDSRADVLRKVIHVQVMEFLKNYNIHDRGMKYEDFAVLRLTKMPAVLLELLFIDNESERALLLNEAFKNGVANEIAYSIARALQLQKIIGGGI